MSFSFNDSFDLEYYLPENFKEIDVYKKTRELTNYIVRECAKDFEDVKYKNRDATKLSDEVIGEIIKEHGFGYIATVIDSLNEGEFSSLKGFISLLNLMKGSRQGLELVLKLLGFDSIIQEWWETHPQLDTFTYQITVVINSSSVPDYISTLKFIKSFARQYVYPIIDNIELKFTLSLAEAVAVPAGFTHAKYIGNIIQKME